MDETTIAARAAACADLFDRFLPDDDSLETDMMNNEHVTSRLVWAEDQMARFNLWVTNLGIFALGHASVEYRLRDYPEIYNLVLQLLEALHANLLYCKIYLM